MTVMKRNTLLSDIKTQLSGFELTDTIDVQGHKFTLSTLTVNENAWAMSFSRDNSLIALHASTQVPKLAASIKAVDGKTIDELVTLDESLKPEEKELYKDPERKRLLQMAEMLDWISSFPSNFIESLWTKYTELNEKRDSSWKSIKN